MYTDGLANPVTVANEWGMVFLSEFATDRPNVLDLGQVPAGATIKMDRAGGYRPTAQAPLVVRVPAGTTSLGRLNIEGWSSGADQELSRFILFDLSAVTNPVRIDGLEMGSVWAPGADVSFDSNITTNGQWTVGSLTTAGAGELHHHTFSGLLPCAEQAPETTTTTTVPEETTTTTTVPEETTTTTTVPEETTTTTTVPEEPTTTTTVPEATTTTTTAPAGPVTTTVPEIATTTTTSPAGSGGATPTTTTPVRPAAPSTTTTTTVTVITGPTTTIGGASRPPVGTTPQTGGTGVPGPSRLPSTGSSASQTLATAAVAMIATGGLLVLARRRHS